MLYALVLSERPTEDAPFATVGAGARECIAPEPHGLDADQDALGIETVEQITEALALFADAIFVADEKIIDEHGVRIDGTSAHLLDAADFDLRTIESGVEKCHSIRRLSAF